jgi:hypothetical protein
MVEDSQRVSSPTPVSASATTAMMDAMSTTVPACPPCTIASTTRPASTGVDTASSAPTTLTATKPPSRRWCRAENRQIRFSRARLANARRSPPRADFCRYKARLAAYSMLM